MADLKLGLIVKAVDRVTGPMKRIEERMGRLQAATRRLNEVNRRMGVLARGSAVGFGALAFGFKRAFVDVAAQFEDFEATLQTVEGSSEKARASMKWIEGFGSKTPFEIADVTQAFVQLRNYGLDPMHGLLRTLGDTSAAMGKPLMQAVEAIADAVTGENERLKEFGIKGSAVKGGRIRYEYTVDGETRFAEALADDRAAIQRTLLGILGGKFGGAMELRSTKFMGVLSNLMDMWTIFVRKVMQSGAFEYITKVLQGWLDKLNKMAADGTLDAYAEMVGEWILNALKRVNETIERLTPWVERLGRALVWAADKLGGWGNLALTLTGLYLARPFISLTGALKGVVSMSGKALGGIRALTAASAAPAVAARAGGIATLGGAAGGLFPGAARAAAPAAAAAPAVAKVGMFAKLTPIFKALGAVLGLISIKFIAIGAVVAVVAGLIYKYWQPIKAFLGGVWEGFTEALKPVIEALQPVWDVFSEIFGGIGELISKTIDWFVSLFEPVQKTTEELDGVTETGKAFGKALGNLVTGLLDFVAGLGKAVIAVGAAGVKLIAALTGGVESKASEPAEAVDKSLGKVGELLPSSDAKRGPLSRLTAAGAAITETMGLGILRAGPDALTRHLARTLGTAAAGLALGLPAAGGAGGGVEPALTAPAPLSGPSVAGATTIENNDYSTTNITIQQQPGEDAGALADRVLREIEQRQRQRARGAEHDEL